MRKPGCSREVTWNAIRNAAIALLGKHGYEAMNLRQLSSMAGLKAGSLYNYFASKQELLFRLICETMRAMQHDVDLALQDVTDPVERAERFVGVLVRWHTENRVECFVGHMELRSLTEAEYDSYVALRRGFDETLSGIIRLGCRRGIFSVADERLATTSILQSLTGIASWYRAEGRLSVGRLTRIYVQMVLAQMQGAPAHPLQPRDAAGDRPRAADAMSRAPADGRPAEGLRDGNGEGPPRSRSRRAPVLICPEVRPGPLRRSDSEPR